MKLRSQSGVTLVEMLVVVAIVAIVAGISFPSLASGLESIRLKSATDSVAAFLNGALNRVERRQEVMDVVLEPKENVILLHSTEPGFERRLELPQGITLVGDERHFVLMPGGTAPRAAIVLSNTRGRHKLIVIDPITGVPQVSDEVPAS